MYILMYKHSWLEWYLAIYCQEIDPHWVPHCYVQVHTHNETHISKRKNIGNIIIIIIMFHDCGRRVSAILSTWLYALVTSLCQWSSSSFSNIIIPFNYVYQDGVLLEGSGKIVRHHDFSIPFQLSLSDVLKSSNGAFFLFNGVSLRVIYRRCQKYVCTISLLILRFFAVILLLLSKICRPMHVSSIFDFRQMFSFYAVCVALGIISLLASLIIEGRSLNSLTSLSSWTLIFKSLSYCPSWVNISFSMPYLVDMFFLCSNVFLFLTVRLSMSSIKIMFLMLLPPIFTVPWCCLRCLLLMRSEKILKIVGHRWYQSVLMCGNSFLWSLKKVLYCLAFHAAAR